MHDVLGHHKILLDQLQDGLTVLSFGEKMKQYPDLFQELFVLQDKALMPSNVIRVLQFAKPASSMEATIHSPQTSTAWVSGISVKTYHGYSTEE